MVLLMTSLVAPLSTSAVMCWMMKNWAPLVAAPSVHPVMCWKVKTWLVTQVMRAARVRHLLPAVCHRLSPRFLVIEQF